MKSPLIEKSKTKERKEYRIQEIQTIKISAPIVKKDNVVREVTINAVLPAFLQVEEVEEKVIKKVDTTPIIIKPVFMKSKHVESKDIAKLHSYGPIYVKPVFKAKNEIFERRVESLSSPGFVKVTPKFLEAIPVETKKESLAPSSDDSFVGVSFLLEEDLLEKIFGWSLNVISEHPIVIFAQKPEDRSLEYLEFLKRILLEVYRIRAEGLPNPIQISSNQRIDEIKSGNSICVVEIDKIDIEKAKRVLYDKLREIYAQGFGFLVFYGKEKNLNEVKKLWNIYRPTPDKGMIFTRLPKFLDVKIHSRDMLFKLPNFMWGMFDGEFLNEEVVLDEYAISLENSFLKKLERLTRFVHTDSGKIPTALLVNPSENESLIHYALKAFVIEYLNGKLSISLDSISTEKELDGVIIDVFVDDEKLRRVAIEIETLYGTCIPLIKLRKTAESRAERGFKTWIVIPNPQLTIYLREVLTLREHLRKRYRDLIEFYTPEVENNKLISIKEFIEKIREGNNLRIKGS